MTSEISAGAVSSARLLTRAEAARALGVSKSTLRRREGNLLKPIKGPRGVHLFDETEVRAVVVRHRRAARTDAAVDGETAAEVFDRLDRAVHPVDIVKELHIDPDRVEQLQAQWARLRGALLLTNDEVKALEATPLSGEFPITSGAILISNLRESLNVACHACGKGVASVCARCVRARVVHERERDQRDDSTGEGTAGNRVRIRSRGRE